MSCRIPKFTMAAHGIDRIPDSLGYLVLTEDGAVISVSFSDYIFKDFAMDDFKKF